MGQGKGDKGQQDKERGAKGKEPIKGLGKEFKKEGKRGSIGEVKEDRKTFDQIKDLQGKKT